MELEATESASGRLIRSRYAAVLGVGFRINMFTAALNYKFGGWGY